MRLGAGGRTLESMTTTYSVNWRDGKGAAVAGRLEVTPDAVVFTPAGGDAVASVPFAAIPAVHRHASTVELERRVGDPIWIESAAAGVLEAHLESVVELTEILRTLREEHERIGAELRELRIAVDGLPGLTRAREHEVELLAIDLARRIVRHARAEERELYPAVERLLGCGPLVAAMTYDHRAIEGAACELARIDPEDRAGLAGAFHRIDALVTTHIAKEEAIVFPLLEQPGPR
jgi:hemerythrin-like domain-containing protein